MSAQGLPVSPPLFKIVCPRRLVTGGPEAMHQLCQALNAQGLRAEMVYWPIAADNAAPEKFRHYAAPSSIDLPDDPGVVVVLPETNTKLVWAFRRAQVLIWWLSVDNHFNAQAPSKWTKRIKRWLFTRLPSQREYAFQPRLRLQHAWQSEYARQFLLKRSVPEPLALTDYVAPALIPEEHQIAVQGRRDQVLFNPAKGTAFNTRLQDACASDRFEFVALKGYTSAQMAVLLTQAKVYIDFGEHPGRDRIPREAAANGCVIITGRQGSAGNEIDVPIPYRYKIDDRTEDCVAQVRHLLHEVMADAPRHQAEQAALRAGIRLQRSAFWAEAAALGEHFTRQLAH